MIETSKAGSNLYILASKAGYLDTYFPGDPAGYIPPDQRIVVQAQPFWESIQPFLVTIAMPLLLVVILGTAGGWMAHTRSQRKKFEASGLSGFSRTFEDPSEGNGSVDGQQILDAWKKAVAEEPEAKDFVSRGLIKSTRLKTQKYDLAGLAFAEEEREKERREERLLKVTSSVSLVTPRPTAPDGFVDRNEEFPVSRKEVTCPTCAAQGAVRCPTCAGEGRGSCPACGGKAFNYCSSCNGTGVVSNLRFDSSTVVTKDSSGAVVDRQTSYAGGSRAESCGVCNGKGRMPCAGCGASGVVACKGCAGSGRVTCPTCAGDKKMAQVEYDIWEYRGLSFRSVESKVEKVRPEQFPEPRVAGKTSPGSAVQVDQGGEMDPSLQKDYRGWKEMMASGLGKYDAWSAQQEGRLLRHAAGMVFAPVTEAEIEYMTRKGKAAFWVRAIGSKRRWVLEASETPSTMTVRRGAKHAAFMGLLVLELIAMAVVVAAMMKLM
jgi:hypothetical protein